MSFKVLKLSSYATADTVSFHGNLDDYDAGQCITGIISFVRNWYLRQIAERNERNKVLSEDFNKYDHTMSQINYAIKNKLNIFLREKFLCAPLYFYCNLYMERIIVVWKFMSKNLATYRSENNFVENKFLWKQLCRKFKHAKQYYTKFWHSSNQFEYSM